MTGRRQAPRDEGVTPQLACEASAWWPDGLQSRFPTPPAAGPLGRSPPSFPPPGGNDHHSWGLRPGAFFPKVLAKSLPTQPTALGSVTRSVVAQMSSDQIYFVFRLANTNQPISHPSLPINMLLSLTQKQGHSWCFETCSGGKPAPRRGCEAPEGKQEAGFPDP